MNETVERFRYDLLGAGVVPLDAVQLARTYARALDGDPAVPWETFYAAVFAALYELARDARSQATRSHTALDSLLRILEDDLGAALFGDAARSLRARLVPLPAVV